jgi:hypothetical protein
VLWAHVCAGVDDGVAICLVMICNPVHLDGSFVLTPVGRACAAGSGKAGARSRLPNYLM